MQQQFNDDSYTITVEVHPNLRVEFETFNTSPVQRLQRILISLPQGGDNFSRKLTLGH